MKKLLLVLLILCSKVTSAQYKPVDEGSEVKFKIKNFGFDVTGSFTGLQGNIYFDPANLANDSVDVSIDAATVNTDNKMRDGHLREKSYFDVKEYPRIRFVSTNITAGDKSGIYIITGNLTIKNITKEISFSFTASPSGDGFIFIGSFRINRKDFTIGGISMVSNELEVSLSVLAKKVLR